MKKSAKIMMFAIGLILTGITGSVIGVHQPSGLFAAIITQYIPIATMILGPFLLLLGGFTKD